MSAIYNVRVSVVDLIEAETGEEAVATLRRRLRHHGFEDYAGDADAFESEDLTPEMVERVRIEQAAADLGVAR